MMHKTIYCVYIIAISDFNNYVATIQQCSQNCSSVSFYAGNPEVIHHQQRSPFSFFLCSPKGNMVTVLVRHLCWEVDFLRRTDNFPNSEIVIYNSSFFFTVFLLNQIRLPFVLWEVWNILVFQPIQVADNSSLHLKIGVTGTESKNWLYVETQPSLSPFSSPFKNWFLWQVLNKSRSCICN